MPLGEGATKRVAPEWGGVFTLGWGKEAKAESMRRTEGDEGCLWHESAKDREFRNGKEQNVPALDPMGIFASVDLNLLLIAYFGGLKSDDTRLVCHAK